ncbi:MAG: hypothetical protein K2Z81_28615, partial [Cyanobacteria bacterium]|nr:hypothetical protein [Cyanobacteriota bacterium]
MEFDIGKANAGNSEDDIWEQLYEDAFSIYSSKNQIANSTAEDSSSPIDTARSDTSNLLRANTTSG